MLIWSIWIISPVLFSASIPKRGTRLVDGCEGRIQMLIGIHVLVYWFEKEKSFPTHPSRVRAKVFYRLCRKLLNFSPKTNIIVCRILLIGRTDDVLIVTRLFGCIDKKEEIWSSPMTKAPTPTEMSKRQVKTQTTPQKSSIKQRLRTDLGRSVGVTKTTQLVWLTGLRAHLPTNRNNRVIKRTHI